MKSPDLRYLTHTHTHARTHAHTRTHTRAHTLLTRPPHQLMRYPHSPVVHVRGRALVHAREGEGGRQAVEGRRMEAIAEVVGREGRGEARGELGRENLLWGGGGGVTQERGRQGRRTSGGRTPPNMTAMAAARLSCCGPLGRGGGGKGRGGGGGRAEGGAVGRGGERPGQPLAAAPRSCVHSRGNRGCLGGRISGIAGSLREGGCKGHGLAVKWVQRSHR